MLTKAAKAIRKLSERQDLGVGEAKEVFDLLIHRDQESYLFFAFTLAMHTKGETSDELLGVCQSIGEITPEVSVDITPDKMIDVSGTGGDFLNTLNVSTAAAFVVASQGLYVPKQAFYSVTGFSGSADLLAQFGVDVPEISKEPTRVVDLLCSTGIATYHFLLHLPETCVGMSNWIKKRQEIGLNFKTFMHLVGFAYSPFPMRSRLYGVYDPQYLTILAELFQKLGYERVLVVHGAGGLDEVSVVGSTKICEVRGGMVRTYEVTPERDLDLKRARDIDIVADSSEGNVKDFLRVLYSVERGAKRDLVLANAGAALYVADSVNTLREGVELAASLVDSGKVASKLEEFVSVCGDPQSLGQLVSKYVE